jgi:hypothetical protein
VHCGRQDRCASWPPDSLWSRLPKHRQFNLVLVSDLWMERGPARAQQYPIRQGHRAVESPTCGFVILALPCAMICVNRLAGREASVMTSSREET